MLSESVVWRSFEGFRLIFSGKRIALDDRMIPIISLPREGSAKDRRALYHMRQIASIVRREEDVPTLMVGLAWHNAGFPFAKNQSITDEDVSNAIETWTVWRRGFVALEKQGTELRDRITANPWLGGMHPIFRAIAEPPFEKPQVAVVAGSMMDDDWNLDRSIASRRIIPIFNQMVWLERDFKFFTRKSSCLVPA